MLLSPSAHIQHKSNISETNSMLQRKILFRKLLQPNNDMITRSLSPRSSRDKARTSTLILRVWEDAQRCLLDIYNVALVDEFLGDRWCDGSAMLERLRLGADVEDCGRHRVEEREVCVLIGVG